MLGKEKAEGTQSRREWLKWTFLSVLTITPFFAFFFRRKKVELPFIDKVELVFYKPKGLEYGEFFPNRNNKDREALGLDTVMCSDAEITYVSFFEFGENSYCITVDLDFVCEPPDPKKEYHFELIAYDKSGQGVAYSAMKTKDRRTLDLDAVGKVSRSVLIREMTVRRAFSLDVIVSREQFAKLAHSSLFCTTTVARS